jgi:hypothetical protein
MESSALKGNNPEAWKKLLDHLDERLQLGLLDKLRKIHSYHIEDETLFLEISTDADVAYLSKPHNFQQLLLLAQDALNIKNVKITLLVP